MQTTSAEIESIIRIVVERLRALTTAETNTTVPSPITRGPVQPQGSLRIDRNLITLEQLDSRLDGIHELHVGLRTVVTPAANDELRNRRIRLLRVEPEPDSITDSRRLMIVASASKTQTIANRTESLSVRTVNCRDCQRDIAELASHISSGDGAAIWCSAKPYAAMRAVASHPLITAVQLMGHHQLQRAIDQANPNVVIVDDQGWSATEIMNLARAWTRSRT